MGILDRLMFWKDDKVDSVMTETGEFDVNGCFMLPEDPVVDTDPGSTADAACVTPVDSIGEIVEVLGEGVKAVFDD